MFVHYRTEGIILKKEDRGEADQLFIIYTKDFGRLEILAKAIRKITSKLRSAMEIFYLSEIEFIQGKIYKTLTDAILIDKFSNLRNDLRKFKIGHQICELLNKLVREEGKDIRIWNLLQEVFTRLNKSKSEIENWQLRVIYYYFFWNLLSTLGYQPELYHCLICQKRLIPERLYFSAKEGGIICQFCQKSVKFSKEIEIEAVKFLRILLEKDWSILKRLKIETKNLDSLKAISQYFLSEIT